MAANLQPYVDERQPADQQLINRLASELDMRQQMAQLSVMLGKDARSFKFDYAEYIQLDRYLPKMNLAAGYGDYAQILAFYKFVFTMERVIQHMRHLDRYIQGVDAMGQVVEAIADLARRPRAAIGQANAANFVAAIVVAPLFQDLLINLFQGQALNDPFNALVNGQALYTLASATFASAYKRSGAHASLVNMLNKLMNRAEAKLTHSATQLNGNINHDLTAGPFIGSNFKCGPGMIPRFVNAAGAAVNPKEALIHVNGKYYLSNQVDANRSGCTAAIEPFGAGSKFDGLTLDARRRRRRRTAVPKRKRVVRRRRVAARAPVALLARRRRRTTTTVRRRPAIRSIRRRPVRRVFRATTGPVSMLPDIFGGAVTSGASNLTPNQLAARRRRRVAKKPLALCARRRRSTVVRRVVRRPAIRRRVVHRRRPVLMSAMAIDPKMALGARRRRRVVRRPVAAKKRVVRRRRVVHRPTALRALKIVESGPMPLAARRRRVVRRRPAVVARKRVVHRRPRSLSAMLIKPETLAARRRRMLSAMLIKPETLAARRRRRRPVARKPRVAARRPVVRRRVVRRRVIS